MLYFPIGWQLPADSAAVKFTSRSAGAERGPLRIPGRKQSSIAQSRSFVQGRFGPALDAGFFIFRPIFVRRSASRESRDTPPGAEKMFFDN